MTTCRRILHWRSTLKFPADRISKISPECIDFLRCLITDADHRLGTRGGVEEVRAHPWFKGIDFSRLQEAEAPYQPEAGGAKLSSLLASLSSLPRGHPDFSAILKEVTANFDDFDALAADDPRRVPGGAEGGGAGGGGAGGAAIRAPRVGGGRGAVPAPPPSQVRSRFIGYTFKRPASSTTSTSASSGGAAGAGRAGGGAEGKP